MQHMPRTQVFLKIFAIGLFATLVLTGCGGGSSPSSADESGNTDSACTLTAEKTWVRAHLDDVYLWYREINEVSPSNFRSPVDYFQALLVRTRDHFSFAESQAVIDAYFQSGDVVGYGATYVRTSDNRLQIAYAEVNSPAFVQHMDRGTVIVNIDGVPEGRMSKSAFSAALFPAKIGEAHSFDVLDPGAVVLRKVTLAAVAVTGTPVLRQQVITSDSGKKVGYLVFNDHVASAEAPLADAIELFKTAGVEDLVLDVRYNGGGYLYIASELAYMIAGAPVRDKVFEKLMFNDKHPEQTNDPANSIPFYDSDSKNAPLPTLGLRRVFVLTGAGSCSATESIINGLRPFVNVVTIGGITCGKPYAFRQANHCGTAYFAIQMEGINAVGGGGYINGIAPTCAAGDDLDHAFGDVNERLLHTALAYQTSGACPASGLTQASSALYAPAAVHEVARPPWREMRLPFGR